MKLIHLTLISVLTLAILGCAKEQQYEGPCVSILPEEIAKKQNELARLNSAAKQRALSEKQIELGVSLLKVEKILSGEDPFPNSKPIFLSPAGPNSFLVLGKYLAFHGWAGAQTLYETEPSSGQYFIVDEILNNTEKESRHSWHASKDNALIRARYNPIVKIMDEIAVCGCGPHEVEVDKLQYEHEHGNANIAFPTSAVFMLPGNKVPSIIEKDFEVSYPEEKINIKYVPKKGKVCKNNQPVC